MPDVAETGVALRPIVSLESGERNGRTGQFLPGHVGRGGRPAGARKAAALLDRSAPAITKHLIARAYKSDRVLCKAADKIHADAGKESTTVNLALNYAALTIPSTLRSTVKSIDASASEPSTTR